MKNSCNGISTRPLGEMDDDEFPDYVAKLSSFHINSQIAINSTLTGL